jgi:hypothetical protein
MKALDKKLIRDLSHLRGQIIAIALVVACGIASKNCRLGEAKRNPTFILYVGFRRKINYSSNIDIFRASLPNLHLNFGGLCMKALYVGRIV